jgi:hypothetical protein
LARELIAVIDDELERNEQIPRNRLDLHHSKIIKRLYAPQRNRQNIHAAVERTMLQEK